MIAAVVDSSALIDALSTEASHDSRRYLTDRELHAPQLIGVEMLSWLRRLSLRGNLVPAQAQRLLAQYETLPIQRYPHEPFLWRAWQLRDTITAYDAQYVVLAEALGAPLITRDRKLATAAAAFCDVIVPD